MPKPAIKRNAALLDLEPVTYYCKTELILKGERYSTTSNCKYHYATMNYVAATMPSI